MTADINFTCSHCGQRIAVESTAAGLEIECPTCRRSLTIPGEEASRDRPHRGAAGEKKRERAKGGPDIQPRGSAPRERSPALEPAGLRDQLAAALAEGERLRANATHAQAEIKSFQTERLALRNDFAHLKQRGTALETQLATLQSESEIQRQRLAATATQLEASERENAHHRAATEEHAAARKHLEEELAAVQSQLAETLAGLREKADALAAAQAAAGPARALLAAMEAQLADTQTTLAATTSEAAALRKLLDDEETGHALLAARAGLKAAEEECRGVQQARASLEAELATFTADRQRFEQLTADLRGRLQEALRRAETVSNEKILEDNTVLRGIIARQNVEIEMRHHDIMRLKRARLGLRLAYALFGLGLLGLIYAAVQYLPEFH